MADMYIDTLTVDVWRGPVLQDPAKPTAIVSQPGSGNVGMLTGVAQAEPIEVETVTITADASAAQTLVSGARGLAGSVVSAEDHLGNASTEVGVLAVHVVSVVNSSEGPLVTIRWTLLVGTLT
jgi:hypothetical protein